MKSRSCGNVLQIFSGYRVTPPSEDYCNAFRPQDHAFVPAAESVDPDASTLPPPVADYEPGTPGHVVHNYCNFSRHVDFGSGDQDAEAHARHRIVRQVVDELDENSIDEMAKSMFTIYMCVRWAPSEMYANMAEGEMST